MKKNILGTSVVTQVAILVHDIEQTAQRYADFFGIEKPRITITDELDTSKAKYKGMPTRGRAKLAFFNIGNKLSLELIQPDDQPSTWREDLNRRGEGFHHIAFEIKGMNEKVAALMKESMPLLQTGEYTGGRYAYIDATKDLKVVLELLEHDTAPVVRVSHPAGVPGLPRGLSLGCWEFGDIGAGPPDEEKSIALIRAAYEMGVTHFDTAESYARGMSESVLGRAVEPFSGKVFIATKAEATGKAETVAAIEKSLQRLRRQYLDLFYIHWPRTGVDPRPMMEALEDLRAREIVRHIGVSNFRVKDMVQVSEAGHIDVCQLGYNLLWRYPERDVIPWCRDHDIPMITYSTIAQGLLSDKPRSPTSWDKGDARGKTIYYRADVWPHVARSVSAMQDAARRASTPLSVLAIRWVLAQEGIISSLVAARTREQLASNVEAARSPIDPAIAGELERLSTEAMRTIPDVGNIFLYYP